MDKRRPKGRKKDDDDEERAGSGRPQHNTRSRGKKAASRDGSDSEEMSVDNLADLSEFEFEVDIDSDMSGLYCDRACGRISNC